MHRFLLPFRGVSQGSKIHNVAREEPEAAALRSFSNALFTAHSAGDAMLVVIKLRVNTHSSGFVLGDPGLKVGVRTNLASAVTASRHSGRVTVKEAQ
jgi:hypothetical protein